MIYAPELGQQAEPRVFYTEHNFRSTYSLCWKVEDDTCAREVMKRLRIRPIQGGIELGKPGEWQEATRLGSDVFHCLITSAAHRKLMEADVTANRVLLD